MGENICKCSNQQGINFQHKQTAHAAHYQKNPNNPIMKIVRISKQTFLQRRHTDGHKADAQHH